MDFILDTHALIWFINGDNQLSHKAKELIRNIDNRCYVNIASIWEIALKISLNKLELNGGFDEILFLMVRYDLQLFPISFEHVQKLLSLEYHHKDPFDRMLIAQAQVEKIPIITKDSNFRLYKVDTIWE